jgi:hypothetical protein
VQATETLSNPLPRSTEDHCAEICWCSRLCTAPFLARLALYGVDGTPLRIGEARRAEAVMATGATETVNGCIAAVLGELRTEDAPDVGDAEVTVRISFVAKP